MMQGSTSSESDGSSPGRQAAFWFTASGLQAPLPAPQADPPASTHPQADIAKLKRQVAELEVRCKQSQDKVQALEQQLDSLQGGCVNEDTCNLHSLDKVIC